MQHPSILNCMLMLSMLASANSLHILMNSWLGVSLIFMSELSFPH